MTPRRRISGFIIMPEDLEAPTEASIRMHRNRVAACSTILSRHYVLNCAPRSADGAVLTY